MDFAIVWVIGAMLVVELGVLAFMNVAVQSFEESVGKSRARVTILEKSQGGVAYEDVFHVDLGVWDSGAGTLLILFSANFQELQVNDWDGSILWKIFSIGRLWCCMNAFCHKFLFEKTQLAEGAVMVISNCWVLQPQ